MEAYIFVLFFILIVVFFVVASFYFAKKRREQLTEAANRLGFSFQSVVQDKAILSDLASFPLFTRGHRRSLDNLLSKKPSAFDGWQETKIFDFNYTSGSGKNRRTTNQTVFMIKDNRLLLPGFLLQPESFFHKVIIAVGYQDIDLSQFPEFSSKFNIRGKDEGRIRAMFSSAVVGSLIRMEKWSLEGDGQVIIAYQHNKLLEPTQLGEALKQVTQVVELLSRISVQEAGER